MIDWINARNLAAERLRQVFTQIPYFEITSLSAYPGGEYTIWLKIGDAQGCVSKDKVTFKV